MIIANRRVIWCFFDKYYLNGRSAIAATYYLLFYTIFIKFYKLGQAFLQNNIRIYTTKLNKEFFKFYSVWVVKYLLYLPDLNPIKHLQAALKAKLIEFYLNLYNIPGNREIKRKVIKEVIKAIFDIMLGEAQWELLRQLIESMPARL